MPLVMGIDVGTQGARVIVCDELGHVVTTASTTFSDAVRVHNLPDGWFEQEPQEWWYAVRSCLREVTAGLPKLGWTPDDVIAVAVDSTSGTILPVDKQGRALRPAIMYNDSRAEAEALECNSAGGELVRKLGCRFGSSFGLPKILWLKRHEPQVWERSRWVIHAADYIVGKLTGQFGVSDYSNALKTGYDLAELGWPRFISDALDIDIEKLPRVVRPGEAVGYITAECSVETGLSRRTLVTAGVSDGTAGFLASGASEVGDWNSTLGTTLVLRGISEELLRDPQGRVYCHRHPDGWWLPGGASNVGGECLSKLFADADLPSMDDAVSKLIPSRLSCYPLMRRGERFPFVQADAGGFFPNVAGDGAELYAACLEGVAYVERWCYEVMQELGAPVGDTIYSTGGGTRSVVWTAIRASVLNKRICKPAVTESAMGSAITAASQTLYRCVSEAVRAMVKYDSTIDPDDSLVAHYEEGYREFRKQCGLRGLGTCCSEYTNRRRSDRG
ncbi:MAG: FGGY family carbohydrate kinase [Armatimonadota bacterium]|nr:FGGY family carbohydrate kinase [Armatimonadota bacterium]